MSGNFRFPNYRQFSKKNRENYRKNIAQIVDKYYITTLSFNIERRSEPRFLFIQLLVGRIYIRSALLSRFHPISIFYQRNAINYYLFYVRAVSEFSFSSRFLNSLSANTYKMRKPYTIANSYSVIDVLREISKTRIRVHAYKLQDRHGKSIPEVFRNTVVK